MATPTEAIRRIRTARREQAPPESDGFERYRSAYRTILVAMRELGGDAALDDLTDRIVERVAETGQLPPPETVRADARAIAADRGVSIEPDSPLRE